MKCLLSAVAVLATLLVAGGPTGDEAAVIAAQKPCYPLTTCVVSGKPVGSGGMTPVDILHEGQLVTFCCSKCADTFKKTPADYIKKIDDAVIAAQTADYPLTTCPMSGEDLDETAKSVVVGSKLVKVCCNDCKKDLLADPTQALVKLDAAYIAKQEKNYPLTMCAVSDEPLGDRPVKVLYGTTLIEFCCKDCVKDFNKEPKAALAKLTAARAAKPAEAPAPK